jgi:hypothetical protein
LGQAFFGLNDKTIYNREIFLLMYYGGFTYHEAKFLPINLRRFFINEISKELKRQNGKTPEEDMDRQLSKQDKEFLKSRMMAANPEAYRNNENKSIRESRAPHHNSPEVRAAQNKQRTNVPTRLLRFNGP